MKDLLERLLEIRSWATKVNAIQRGENG